MSSKQNLQVAIRLAREYALSLRQTKTCGFSEVRNYRYHIAMGDAQASLDRVMSVLDGYGLIGDDGHLESNVHLVCTGDYFDFGSIEDRHTAGADGMAFLAWLAAHPRDQTKILLGNHDFARVGEFVRYDDERFAKALEAARWIEQDEDGIETNEQLKSGANAKRLAYSLANPDLPSFEYASRYYACFQLSQKELLTRLLREQRCDLAYAHGPKLLCSHAGVTQEQLRGISSNQEVESDAELAATVLNRALREAVLCWTGDGPLDIDGLHRVGNAKMGPSGGMLSHRPCNPEILDPLIWQQKQSVGRLYDVRMVPNFLQICGHVRDEECIERFGPWSMVSMPQCGVLRHLAIRDKEPVYDHGVGPGTESEIRFIFIDGHMQSEGSYPLLDLDRLQPFEPVV